MTWHWSHIISSPIPSPGKFKSSNNAFSPPLSYSPKLKLKAAPDMAIAEDDLMQSKAAFKVW